MMPNDNGPKDGDYVKYVAALEQVRLARHVSAPVQMEQAVNTTEAGESGSARAELLALLKTRQQAGQQAGHDHTTGPVHANAAANLDAATKKNFVHLIRALALAFVAFVIAAPMLPEPFNVIIRLAVIFYVIYALRKMQPALAVLRTRLDELKQQGKR